MERKLATIQEIKSIDSIEGADSIEVASILGWKVVVKKDEFKQGELCIYCEIDSVLPEREEFEFLRNRKFRIKTVKLRGQISQGIVFPLSILSKTQQKKCDRYGIGTDLTETLEITKYEIPLDKQLGGNIKGNFTIYVPKTDEIRIQSEPELIEEIQGVFCYITTKLDGTSATFIKNEDEIHVCSRNNSLKQTDNNIYWDMYKKYNLESILNDVPFNVAIQGEICGPKIQKNPLGLEQHSLFVFNVYDIDKQWYINKESLESFCIIHGLQTVPIDKSDLEFTFNMDDLLKMAEGKYSNGKEREGIVIRPMKETYSNVLKGRLSFKVVNNKYLLKEK